MRRFQLFCGLLLVVSLAACGRQSTRQLTASRPTRIVSMAPNATEILFALGAGDRVVGVTNFCFFPPAAKTRTKVGGFDDPNLEVLGSLAPDLVVSYRQHDKVRAFCDRAGIRLLPLELESLADVERSIAVVGAAIDSESQATRLVASIRAELDAVRRAAAPPPRPRVLLVLGAGGPVADAPIAVGGPSFLSALLEIAGGENVFADLAEPYARVSKEAIVERAPDVIVELEGEWAMGPVAADPVDAWSVLAPLPAVTHRRVHRLRGSHVLTPGPRVGQIARELQAALQGQPS